jgi:hypothetical protein
VLASFGRSLGIRRIYVQALLNIFQVSTIEKIQHIPSVVDRHCFDADHRIWIRISMLMPIRIRVWIWIRIGIKTTPIHRRILPQVSHMMENKKKFQLFLTSMTLNNVLPFSSVAKVTVKCVMILSILLAY